jgi:hypothetical protein
MPADVRMDRRVSLLGRADLFPNLDGYVDKALKQMDVLMPVLTGRAGIGRTAMLHELGERQSVIGRNVGFGAVQTGLGQAVADIVTSLAESIAERRPGAPSVGRLQAAVESFVAKSPDEGTEQTFSQAMDYLLYVLSNEVNTVPGGFVLLLDDLHLANEKRVEVMLEGLVALSNTGAPIPVVLSAKSIGRRTLGVEEVALRPLTNADLADLAQRSGLTLSPEIIRAIGGFADGRPGRAVAVLQRAIAAQRTDLASIQALIDRALEEEQERVELEELERRRRSAPVAEVPPSPPVAVAAPAPVAQPVDAVAQPVDAVAPTVVEAIEPPIPARKPSTNLKQPPVITPRLPTHKPESDSPGLSRSADRTDSDQPGSWPTRADLQPRDQQVPDLNAQQWRVLERSAELIRDGHSLTLKLLQRVLGEVSRFGGAASPVADAVNDLTRYGILVDFAGELSLSPLGEQAMVKRVA